MEVKNGVDITFEIKENRLWFEMDEPEDKDMIITIYEVPSDTHTIIGQGAEGKKTIFHQSALGPKHMLLPGTYIFTFSNDKHMHLSVVFIYNKLSFEVKRTEPCNG
jgi:hypothetical protein